jgi:hypothetical protein
MTVSGIFGRGSVCDRWNQNCKGIVIDSTFWIAAEEPVCKGITGT